MRTTPEDNLNFAEKYLRDLRLPKDWMLMRASVDALYPMGRLPLVDYVTLELQCFRVNPPLEVTVDIRPREWDPEWLYATLLTLPEAVPIKKLEVNRYG